MDCELKRFFVVLTLLRICKDAAAYTFPLALANCKDHCGDVSVLYPFGIGQGCYKDKWFEVVCSNSSDQVSVPFLLSIRREVLSFDLGSYYSIDGRFHYQSNKIHILSPLKHTGCSNGSVGDSSSLNLTGSPFFISDSNKFTAIGCNNKALMKGQGSQIVGCEATCTYENDTARGCVGYKCCQTQIPSGLQVFDATVEKMIPGQAGCQVAYLTHFQLSPFMFKSPQLPEYSNYVMMELQWALDGFPIPSEGSTTVLCAESTKGELTPITSADLYLYPPTGYQCWCKHGYQGNPYIPGGCQDIDECRNSYENNCGKNKCVNVSGSFRCERIWPAILSGTLSTGLLLLVVGTWWLCKVNKKRKAAKQKRKFFKRNGGLLLEQQTLFLQGSVNRTKLFSSNDLEKATDRFNASRILGQGGQGTVYKGMLEDGMIVAVKKSKALEEANLEEFINEIILLSQINHRNVVKILGCCLETEVPILVYEFIPNRNLFDHLHNPSEDFPMTWEVRLYISCEVADALSYLHSAASIPIYHRDVKSTNILLDERHRAKVSDFGISRSVPIDNTHLTTIVQGTIGYVDPEYLQSSHFTGKSDVYSFGVLLIELLTGEKPVSLLRRQEVRMLGAYFLDAMRNDRLHEILDARIKEDCDKEEVLAVANLARRCLSLNSEHRPTMRDVSNELDRMQSKKRGIQSRIQNDEEHRNIRVAMPESMSLFYSSPDIVIENSSFSLESEPLMLHKTQ
ncbi:PREDICTED: wall-associated receptor kinase-like 8 [Camelina sativa]|uniref:Wall-associated receptor kinase-like 8 n=1 Tax=Camelina sativa TaxID=90675 RepID=A0ABM0Y9S6_CAMSA|nr:PREDICTED: wall-associated receptor kinase-like 8 [Camelina sativa]